MDSRRYLVKEMFGPTLQGEGAHAGMPCVFLRFAVCNLACTWCDTDFAPDGARRMDAPAIVDRLRELDIHRSGRVVVTGGEPTLQWDVALARAIADAGFRVHMETNGTRALEAPVDWLTVSPKPQFHPARETLVVTAGDECKVVVDRTVDERVLAAYETMRFDRWYLQPCQDDAYQDNLARAVAFATTRPRWRLSLQLHKILGLP